ncbi:universal stress protein [Kitasatospora cinereorecta]
MSTGTSRTPGQVVVGIDGSGHARAAAYWAAAEADAQGQELRILHAADLDRLTRFASFETVESTRETVASFSSRWPRPFRNASLPSPSPRHSAASSRFPLCGRRPARRTP